MKITTDRLILREFQEADWEPILSYQSQDQYLRFYRDDHRSADDARAFVRMFMSWRDERPRRKYQLGIVLPGERRLIGNVGIRQEFAGATDAELGYELDPHYWGRGYATEAARAMLDFGFTELKLHRISAYCIAENSASSRVLERVGMRREGVQRQKEWMKGRWWDTYMYAMLRHEWRRAEVSQVRAQRQI
jgi:[ribosomal protein S5]-alanine N-acetyltransferase